MPEVSSLDEQEEEVHADLIPETHRLRGARSCLGLGAEASLEANAAICIAGNRAGQGNFFVASPGMRKKKTTLEDFTSAKE